MDLDALLGELQAAQQVKSSTKLSERTVVELINKLKQLGILGDDLLYTINGKEYITTDRLRDDIKRALSQVRTTPRFRRFYPSAASQQAR